MNIKFIKNNIQTIKKIDWNEVIDVISKSFELEKIKIISNNNPPTFLLDEMPHLSKNIQNGFDEIKKNFDVNVLHLYISFCKNSGTFGRHNDTMDVVITQCIGEVSYAFDDGTIYNLSPGDSLLIPKGIYHTPIVHGPRVTFSCSWEE